MSYRLVQEMHDASFRLCLGALVVLQCDNILSGGLFTWHILLMPSAPQPFILQEGLFLQETPHEMVQSLQAQWGKGHLSA